ncbi:MCP four helix bundle domain-containing protein [Herbaspirillum sp. AP02]|uniref:methyl-accepting chemotaxis protein n=1 Tax=unclassified Herbaspirillum TaxID=2624150 RepID=UPI0015DB015D|nr:MULTISPECIES: methyl-accepting chemotaxis protein [unclassified Herbaspirillum]MBG7621184.1 MCP four helix bundle domain-containing protein [Herbaspirillum sp. AP02]NZD68913.1 MCP four helix bundle domain-containing protein [Herbaspirillum sp. AP21]
MRFSNLSITTRLAFAFSILILVIAAIVTLGLIRLGDINKALDLVVNDRYKKIALINTISGKIDDVAIAVRNQLLTSSPEQAAREQKVVNDLSLQVTAHLKELDGVLINPAARAQLANVMKARDEYAAQRREVEALNAKGQRDAAIELLITKVGALQKAYFGELDNLADTQQKMMDQSVIDAESAYNTTRLIMLVSGLVSALFAASIAWTISRSITRPLNRAVEVAETVAAGDLTAVIAAHSTDETGRLLQALAAMNQKLKAIVLEVRRGTDSMVTASTQIATGNLDLSSRTEEQASALEETASSLEQLTSSVKQNADHTRKSSDLASNATQVANQGGQAVKQVVQTMGAINDSSRKIVDIISVIDGIAFQTNILALNAAVEAARAGEQGRGFAVVASEVRGLAQRSATAAKEIKELINDSVSQVTSGTELVAQAGSTMDEVVHSIEQVSHIVGEISAATREQSDGIEQVNQAIMQMDNTTQQNAALVEEAAAASQALQDQAQRLLDLVSVFRLDEKGAAPEMRSVQATAMRKTPPMAVAPAASPAKALPARPATAAAPAASATRPALPASRKEEKSDEWETF